MGKKQHCDDFVEIFLNSPSNKIGLRCLHIQADFHQNDLCPSRGEESQRGTMALEKCPWVICLNGFRHSV